MVGCLNARHVFLIGTPELGPDFIVELQMADPILEAILAAVRDKNVAAAEHRLLAIYNAGRPAKQQAAHLPSRWRGVDFKMFSVTSKGVLVRKQPMDDGSVRTQLVVPLDLRKLVLEEKHGGLHAGHDGVKRTIERILLHYWWPGLSEDVAAFVSSCIKCLRVKPKRGRWTLGMMQPLPVVYQPFERVAVDIVTVQETNPRYKYVLTMVDHATRYLEAAPLTGKTAQEVADVVFNRLFLRYGPVNVLLSDRGGEFCNQVSEALFREMGVTHVTTAPYHPQTNGLVERINSTLVTYLRAFCERDPDNWFRYLGAAVFAYNTAFQTSLAATPYFLMFGRDPVDSCDLLLEDMSGLREEEPKVSVTEWSHRLEVARHVAQEHLVAAQDRMTNAANVNRRQGNEIAVGSWVYLRPTLERQPKLATFGAGLFCVEKRQGNYLELVDLEGARRQANIADVVLIRQPPVGHAIMDPYQRVRALLHKCVTIGESVPRAGVEMEMEHEDEVSFDPPSELDESYDPFEENRPRGPLPNPKDKEEQSSWEFAAETKTMEGSGNSASSILKDKKDFALSEQDEKLGDAEEEIFVIERILKHSVDKGVLRLKVRFVGYGPEDDLWYDEKDLLETMPEGVQRYKEQHNLTFLPVGRVPESDGGMVERVIDRIVDATVHNRRLYVQVGFRNESNPDPESDTWFFFSDLNSGKTVWLQQYFRLMCQRSQVDLPQSLVRQIEKASGLKRSDLLREAKSLEGIVVPEALPGQKPRVQIRRKKEVESTSTGE